MPYLLIQKVLALAVLRFKVSGTSHLLITELEAYRQ